MPDAFLDLDALSAAAAFTPGGSRKAYPILVDDYFKDGLDPTKHHIIGRRADPLAPDPVAQYKVFLDPTDPTANNTDPNKRRPSILSFAFPEYAAAWAQTLSADPDTKTAAIKKLTDLAQDTRAKTYTEAGTGGIVIADGVQEPGEGVIIARWIRPGRSKAADDKHILPPIDWATVRRRTNGHFDVEVIRATDAVVTTNIGELEAAILAAFKSAPTYGNAAVYLRLLQKNADGTVRVMIPGGTAPGGGRIDLRDKKVGDQYVSSAPEDEVKKFLATPLGQKLAGPWGASTTIEVIPLSVIIYGEKSLEKRKDPDATFRIPPADEKTGAGLQGYAVSTVRLSAVANSDHFVASMAAPVTGELLRLEDLPTTQHHPDVEPAFAVFARKDTADSGAPLTDNFDL